MANEIVLVEYDKACRQLARAVYVNEVMKIRERAAIMNACSKVLRNKQLEADAWKLRVQAERRLGEMLRDGRDDRAKVGGDRDGSARDPSWKEEVKKPTLNEMGIGKALADRARGLAELSSSDFGEFLIDGAKQNERHVEVVAKAKSKPKKKKSKPTRELECPHCGKPVYLKDGRLEK